MTEEELMRARQEQRGRDGGGKREIAVIKSEARQSQVMELQRERETLILSEARQRESSWASSRETLIISEARQRERETLIMSEARQSEILELQRELESEREREREREREGESEREREREIQVHKLEEQLGTLLEVYLKLGAVLEDRDRAREQERAQEREREVESERQVKRLELQFAELRMAKEHAATQVRKKKSN